MLSWLTLGLEREESEVTRESKHHADLEAPQEITIPVRGGEAASAKAWTEANGGQVDAQFQVSGRRSGLRRRAAASASARRFPSQPSAPPPPRRAVSFPCWGNLPWARGLGFAGQRGQARPRLIAPRRPKRSAMRGHAQAQAGVRSLGLRVLRPAGHRRLGSWPPRDSAHGPHGTRVGNLPRFRSSGRECRVRKIILLDSRVDAVSLLRRRTDAGPRPTAMRPA
jgi:hypothetical protein